MSFVMATSGKVLIITFGSCQMGVRIQLVDLRQHSLQNNLDVQMAKASYIALCPKQHL